MTIPWTIDSKFNAQLQVTVTYNLWNVFISPLPCTCTCINLFRKHARQVFSDQVESPTQDS